MDALMGAIGADWRWAIPPPVGVLAVSKFGNVLVAVEDGSVWRICPEEVSCERVSPEVSGFASLMLDPGFRASWDMTALVAEAERTYGVQEPGRCFCLKIPSVLGGTYTIENVGRKSLVECVSFAGCLGLQIKDLPDGATIEFDFGD